MNEPEPGPATGGPRRSRDPRVWCSLAISVTIAYGLIFLPLRPLLLALSPEALAAITGSRLALIALGVLARTGEATLWWPVPVAIVSIMKFHWVYWWAGRLWGRQVLERFGGTTKRARRRIARAEALVRRYQVLAIAATYVPVPVAREVVLAGIGSAGVRLRTFLLVDLAIATVSQLACVAVGLAIGERAVPLLRQYAVWAGLISLGVLAAMIVTWWRGSAVARRRGEPAETTEPAAPTDASVSVDSDETASG